MNKLPLLALLLLSGGAFAGAGSSASATGSVYQVTPQTNLINNSNLPFGTVGEAHATCATSSLSVGVVGSHNDAFNDFHSLGQSAGVTFSMPIDLNGVNERCAKQQNAINRITTLKADRMSIEEDGRILAMCINALEKGIVIDSQYFRWASKCNGIYESAVLLMFNK